MFKRIGLFLVLNFVVLITISVLVRLLGAVLALGDAFFLAVSLCLYQDVHCFLRGTHRGEAFESLDLPLFPPG